MGNHIQKLSERVFLVATSDTWIEGKAIQQLKKTAELEGIIHVAGMPDLHPGRGYPIGAAFLAKNRVYPALIGNDIGCGMSLWQTDIAIRKTNFDKFERRLGNLDQPLEEKWQSEINNAQEVHHCEPTGFESALGTIGGGNHFAELQQVDRVLNQSVFDGLELDRQHLVLLVHSGSRGLGQAVLQGHLEQFGHAGLKTGSVAFDDYHQRHDQALAFAKINRMMIAKRFLDRLGSYGSQLLDVTHNMISRFMAKSAEEGLWLHRKGVTPADAGVVMIPGSRGDFSYLVMPKTCNPHSKESLISLAHGAGRKWMRSECKPRLSRRYRVKDLTRTSFGSRVICDNKKLIFEEAPEAYKSVDSVIDAMQQAGLIDLIARFRPVLTYKTAGDC